MLARAMFGGLALWLLTTAPAAAQPGIGVFTIDANGIPNGRGGQLMIQASESGSNQVSGTVFGDRLAGYYAPGARKAVWIRFSRTGDKPIQAYVGAYSSALARPEQAGQYDGYVYALNADGGASTQANAWGFRAQANALVIGESNARVIGGVPVNRTLLVADPAPSTVLLPEPAGAWWMTANEHQSPLVLEVGANGEVSGFIFGDPILGHYATETRRIAFLRMQRGAPVQFYQGYSARVASGAIQFRGSFMGLTEAAGATPQDNTFDFDARDQSSFVRIQSRATNGCLGAPPGIGSFVRQAPCHAALSMHFAFFDNPSVMVTRSSGLCVTVLNPNRGAGFRQLRCTLGASQRVGISTISLGACTDCIMLPFTRNFCITISVAGRVEQGSCGIDAALFVRLPRAP